MKTRNFAWVIIMLLFTQVAFAQKVDVNTKTSSIHWLGKKIGGQHDGSIQLASASIELENDKIVAGKFVIDMTTISNSDLKDEGTKQKLIGHLK